MVSVEGDGPSPTASSTQGVFRLGRQRGWFVSASFVIEVVFLFRRNPVHLKLLGSNSSALAGTTPTAFTFRSSPMHQGNGKVLHLLILVFMAGATGWKLQ